ncbi:MAG: hypothetical protein MRY63_04710 [Neomegalonema sp.]|nr:hypothetical protein [Neomegalonema sp.]
MRSLAELMAHAIESDGRVELSLSATDKIVFNNMSLADFAEDDFVF